MQKCYRLEQCRFAAGIVSNNAQKLGHSIAADIINHPVRQGSVTLDGKINLDPLGERLKVRKRVAMQHKKTIKLKTQQNCVDYSLYWLFFHAHLYGKPSRKRSVPYFGHD